MAHKENQSLKINQSRSKLRGGKSWGVQRDLHAERLQSAERTLLQSIQASEWLLLLHAQGCVLADSLNFRRLLKPPGHPDERCRNLTCLQRQAAEDREDWQQAMLGPLVDGSALAQLDIVTGSDTLKTMQVSYLSMLEILVSLCHVVLFTAIMLIILTNFDAEL